MFFFGSKPFPALLLLTRLDKFNDKARQERDARIAEECRGPGPIQLDLHPLCKTDEKRIEIEYVTEIYKDSNNDALRMYHYVRDTFKELYLLRGFMPQRYEEQVWD